MRALYPSGSGRAIATDVDDHELREDDSVMEMDGELYVFRLQIMGVFDLATSVEP